MTISRVELNKWADTSHVLQENPKTYEAIERIWNAYVNSRAELNLAHLNIYLLPSEVASLKVTQIDLSNNFFVTLPDQILKLTNLTTIHAVGCQIASLPEEVACLRSLTQCPDGK